MRKLAILVLPAMIPLAGCGESAAPGANVQANASAEQANDIAADPFGATGAPGADLTDNGATDGANGLAANESPDNAQ